MAYLLIGEQVFPLDRKSENVIGRLQNCDIPIDGLYVSRRHATLKKDSTGYLIIDHGSRNGTFVKGRRIQSQLLEDGEQIEIGRVRCQFRRGTPEHMRLEFNTLAG